MTPAYSAHCGSLGASAHECSCSSKARCWHTPLRTRRRRVGCGQPDDCFRGAMRHSPGRRASVLAFVQAGAWTGPPCAPASAPTGGGLVGQSRNSLLCAMSIRAHPRQEAPMRTFVTAAVALAAVSALSAAPTMARGSALKDCGKLKVSGGFGGRLPAGVPTVASLCCCKFTAAQVPGGGQSMRRSPPRSLPRESAVRVRRT